MRVPVRILAATAGVVVVLLIGATIFLSTIDAGSFIRPIQARVRQETGRELVVRSIDLRLSFEPRLVATDVTLGNAPWASAPVMIGARRVEAQVALLPLLRRRFETVRLVLIEPVIALETDARGRRNWETGGADATRAASGAQTGAAGFAALGSGSLEIEKGTLTYRDGRSGKTTQVSIERLALASAGASSPVDAEFRGSVDGVAIAVSGTLGALAQRDSPYPIALRGEVDGRRTSLALKARANENAIELDDIDLAFGQSRLTGRLTVGTGAARTRIAFRLDAPALSSADLPVPVPAASAPVKAATSAPSRWVFDDNPVDLAALRTIDADGEIGVARLLLADGRQLADVKAKLSLHEGVLDIPAAQVSALGGTATIGLRVDASRDPDDALKLVLNAKGLDLGALARAAGIEREITGGKTDVAADLAMQGASPRRWAASANGSIAATVGPATLGRPAGGQRSELDPLAQAVNPFRSIQAATELRCAVVRLPIRAGVAHVDRTIALETHQIGVAASGTIDFRNETLDLAVKPHLKRGIPIDLVQLADLVRVGGTFRSPAVRVDSAATAETLGRIGAAVGTGGWSEAARLLVKSPGGDAGTCDVAAGRAPGETASATQGSSGGSGTAQPVEGISKALKQLFGR